MARRLHSRSVAPLMAAALIGCKADSGRGKAQPLIESVSPLPKTLASGISQADSLAVADGWVYWPELVEVRGVTTDGRRQVTVDRRPDCHDVYAYGDRLCWLAWNEVVCRQGDAAPEVVHRRGLGLFEGLAVNATGVWFGLDMSDGEYDLGVYLFDWDADETVRVVPSMGGFVVMDASERYVYYKAYGRDFGKADATFYRVKVAERKTEFVARARARSVMRVWGSTAYFTDYTDRVIRSVWVGGGAPSVLLETIGAPYCLGVGARWISWCTQHGVYAARREGGRPMLVAVDRKPWAVVVDGDHVFWVSEQRVGRVRLPSVPEDS